MNDYKNTELQREIDDWFQVRSNEMLEDLRRIIEVKSVNSPAEDGAPYGVASRAGLNLAGSMLEARGFKVREFEDMIISADFGPNPPLMGILAHIDVVDAGEGWDSDPFEMTLKDGKIYGRGTSDDKGPAIAAMYAMYCAGELCPEFRHGFRLILGSGEEVGCEDIAHYLKKNEPPPNVFTPDAEYPVVNVEKGRTTPFFEASWERDLRLPRVISITGGKTMNVVPNRASAIIDGYSLDIAETICREYSGKTGATISVAPDGGKLVITAQGKATHAATPDEGLNAQTALIEMLASMHFEQSKGFEYICALNRLFPHGDHYGRAFGIEMSDEISGKLTVNFGVLDFSETGFTGNFDSRTSACADDADLPAMVRASFEREGITVTELSHSKCHHTPEDSPFVQTLLRVYEEYTGNPGECLKIGGQTYVHEIPGGVAYGCAMPGNIYNIHGANEFIGADELITSAKMFARVILEMCG